MNPATLRQIVPTTLGWPRAYSKEDTDQLVAKYIDSCNLAMNAANCNTVERARCFCATVFDESAWMTVTEEIPYRKEGANAEGYSGRQLDYYPYVGRTLGQLTWKAAYAAFGRFAVSLKLITDPDYFVKNPKRLADPQWSWLGPASYWNDHNMNQFADNGGFLAVSRAYNGGNSRAYEEGFTPQGWADRQVVYARCAAVGSDILPTSSEAITPPVTPPATSTDLIGKIAAEPTGFARAILEGM